MGSPGSGKTVLLEATAGRFGRTRRLGAGCGDLATDHNSRRLEAAGIDACSITTGSACHLDARVATAAFLGTVHTLAGPDHYVPFLAMARARRWTARRTVAVTLACGVGHVAGSVVLGVVGIAAGLALGWMEWLEGARGDLAAWLLVAFGLAYAAWGLRRGWRGRPHAHWHRHGDGTVHHHGHGHRGSHAHVHDRTETSGPEGAGRVGTEGAEAPAARSLTPWVLFTIFVFGPCEPLIPVLMVPAAAGSWTHVAIVTAVFAAATLTTMTATVLAGYHGLSRLRLGPLATHAERYAHALAGLALAGCGVAVHLGL